MLRDQLQEAYRNRFAAKPEFVWVLKFFDPAKHPRDVKGRWSEVGGLIVLPKVEVRPYPADTSKDVWDSHNQLKRVLEDHDTMAFLEAKGITFSITNGKYTDLPGNVHLRGVTPRGWGATGFTWDSVAGGYNVGGKQVELAGGGQGHSVGSVAAHETGHALTHAILIDILQHPESGGVVPRFSSILATEWKLAVASDSEIIPYYRQTGPSDMDPKGFTAGAEEMFAEAYSAYVHFGADAVGDLFGASFHRAFIGIMDKVRERGRMMRAARAGIN